MSRARKICASSQCPDFAEPGVSYCRAHQPKPWASSTRRSQLPRGWSSRIVPRILKRDPFCTLRFQGCTGFSEEVHHVGPTDVHEDWNLAGTCSVCHLVATLEQAAAARARNAA